METGKDSSIFTEISSKLVVAVERTSWKICIDMFLLTVYDWLLPKEIMLGVPRSKYLDSLFFYDILLYA